MTDFKTIELCKNLKFGNPPPKPNTIPLKDIIKANAGNEENKNQVDTHYRIKHPEERGKIQRTVLRIRFKKRGDP